MGNVYACKVFACQSGTTLEGLLEFRLVCWLRINLSDKLMQSFSKHLLEMSGRTCWDIDVLKGRVFSEYIIRIEYFIKTVIITNFAIKDSNRSQIVAPLES